MIKLATYAYSMLLFFLGHETENPKLEDKKRSRKKHTTNVISSFGISC